ncbi:restriction endonuclease subunit S [Cochleicola gelatinilyticus]|uniref:Type I restriction modification DNA specificity domain-containing protein n=1 Tax=Cochleicola gelatinilyticus TaxID=1763537 RepID=A0A167KFV7_9FLAO|nr:restriction endonuclease subunit S [Cochleicola gelatinilyticus]OAB81848.1 hypothetical protein ULVI_00495 [Cochleicola gelatinilyticus]
MGEDTLPKGWVETELENLTSIKSGGTPSRSNKSYWQGSIPWIKISDIKSLYVDEATEFITEEGLNNSAARIFPKGTILFTIFATIGRIGILNIEATTNQAIAGLSPTTLINKMYLIYSLQKLADEIMGHGKGVAQKNINQTILKATKIPLPPRSEQDRIVAKVDALIAQVTVMQESLKRIPHLLKDFSQQVLTQAVTGKLTEEWREGKELGEWNYEVATQCCKKVQSGGTPRGGNFSNKGIPFFKVYNIVNQKISFDYKPQFVTEEIQNSQCKKSICFSGDVLMNIVGPPLNKVAIIPKRFKECNINQAITVFRPKDYLSNKFLYYFLREGSPVNMLVNETRGVVGQVNISLTQCREFVIPIPSEVEQQEIVRQVESLFSKADAIEQQYLSLKQKIDTLPQAILHKAFKGELVEQLASDGDARELLSEIEMLKSKSKTKKKPKTKSKKYAAGGDVVLGRVADGDLSYKKR